MNMNLANYLYNVLNDLIKKNDEDLAAFNKMVSEGATREEQEKFCSNMKVVVDLFYELKPYYESYIKEPNKEKEEELLNKFDKILPLELKSKKNREAIKENGDTKKEIHDEEFPDLDDEMPELKEEIDDEEFPDLDDEMPELKENDELNDLLHNDVEEEMSSSPDEKPLSFFKKRFKDKKEKAKSKSILRRLFGKKDSLDDKVNELLLV